LISCAVTSDNRGVDVISIALGGIKTSNKERLYKEAIQDARNKNCIVKAAPGNSSADAYNYVPASIPGLIALGSINKQRQKE